MLDVIVNKIIIDDNNNIEYSANGIESVTGIIGHNILFSILKQYRKPENKVKCSQNYFECMVLEGLAKDLNYKIIENVRSYKF